MDMYLPRADTHNGVDTAAEFVDTFYSYHDSYYETIADSLSGDDAGNIIDLYYASRPETPSDLSSDSTALTTANVVDNHETHSTDDICVQKIHDSNCKIISRGEEKCPTSGPGTAGQTDELKHTQKDKTPLDLFKDSPHGENKELHE